MNNLLPMVRALFAWIYTGLYWSFILLIYLLSFRTLSDEWVASRVRKWGKQVLRILAVQVEFIGTNYLERADPRVVVVNHQSALDIMWGATIYPPRALAIGKKEIIWIPFVNIAWWVFRHIRIDRKDRKSALHSLQHVSEEITKNSRSLFIAPEGTRTSDGTILRFKKGAFHIALQSQVPIYPIVVAGAFELLPKGALWPKPGMITISFLPPTPTQGLTLNDLDSLIEKVRTQMVDTFNTLQKRRGAKIYPS